MKSFKIKDICIPELKMNEIFKIGGVKYQQIEGDDIDADCIKCSLENKSCCEYMLCDTKERKDKKSCYFKLINN